MQLGVTKAGSQERKSILEGLRINMENKFKLLQEGTHRKEQLRDAEPAAARLHLPTASIFEQSSQAAAPQTPSTAPERHRSWAGWGRSFSFVL